MQYLFCLHGSMICLKISQTSQFQWFFYRRCNTELLYPSVYPTSSSAVFGDSALNFEPVATGRACRSLDPLMPSICGVFFYPQSFTCLDTAHAHSSAVTGRRLAWTEVFSLMSHFCQNTMTFSERCASDGQRKVKFWHGCNCDLWTEYTHVAMKEWTFKDWKN